MSFNMYMPTRIIFGKGRLNDINTLKMPGTKAMIAISNGKSVIKNGYLDRTLRALQNMNIQTCVFDKINANPTKSVVMEGAEFAKKNCCDFIVALGGGSVLDASKIIAMITPNQGDLWEYVSGGTGLGKIITEEPLPVVCITTTAGTGSEVDQWGVITNEETQEKIGCGGYDSLFPTIAIVDPELMESVPPKFTAYQGFDALFHSTESYISTYANMMSDMYALTSIEYVGKYLVRAYENGNDKEAREGMAFANTLAGVVMTISVTTAEHSIEHAMSAYHPDLPHGAGLIMISKAFYKFFIDRHVCDEKFIKMAQLLGISNASKAEDFIIALDNIQKACNVHELKMSEYGIKPDEFKKIAKNARETMGGLYSANPCEMRDEDVVEILKKSYL